LLRWAPLRQIEGTVWEQIRDAGSAYVSSNAAESVGWYARLLTRVCVLAAAEAAREYLPHRSCCRWSWTFDR